MRGRRRIRLPVSVHALRPRHAESRARDRRHPQHHAPAREREHLALAAASRAAVATWRRASASRCSSAARAASSPPRPAARWCATSAACTPSLHALESEVAEFARGIKGHLRIAANAGAIAECLPPDLAAFSQAHPQIRISLEDQTSAEVAGRRRRGPRRRRHLRARRCSTTG
ncbi:MAG: hypothetical protein MZW92_73865 [Comamonadaceae bacterium]|nr:hypothetical protein [Comamonadaceae bacterium]